MSRLLAALTTGMYFLLQASWRVEINAQPLIVYQYKGALVDALPARAPWCPRGAGQRGLRHPMRLS